MVSHIPDGGRGEEGYLAGDIVDGRADAGASELQDGGVGRVEIGWSVSGQHKKAEGEPPARTPSSLSEELMSPDRELRTEMYGHRRLHAGLLREEDVRYLSN